MIRIYKGLLQLQESFVFTNCEAEPIIVYIVIPEGDLWSMVKEFFQYKDLTVGDKMMDDIVLKLQSHASMASLISYEGTF